MKKSRVFKATILILLNLLFWKNSHALEYSHSFLISVFDRKVKVSSPDKYYPDMEIIIENKTLTKIMGKLTSKINRQAEYFTLPPESQKTFHFALKSGDQVSFVPLAPAFQEVPLKFGVEDYEIPDDKNKDQNH